MFAEGEIEAVGAEEYCAGMGEFIKSPLAVISAHTRMSRPVERNTLDHQMDADLIDASAAILLGAHHFLCPFHIFGKQIKGQSVFARCDELHHCINLTVPVSHNRQQRIEQFMPHQFLVGVSSQDIKASLTTAVKAQTQKVNDVLKPQSKMNLLKRY